MKDPSRRARIIFTRALELEGAAREQFLRRECTDPALRREVDSLLEHLDAAAEFLEVPAVASAPPPPEPGDVLGSFRLIRRLGEGATGFVYEAHDRTSDRLVALKVFKRPVVDGHEARERFRREAEIAARLRHPNIVPSEGLFEDAGRLFIVSELCAGVTLTRHAAARGGHLPEKETASIVAAVADGLHHAHGAGVIHRDVKPANVLMEHDGTPRLTDFGHAKDLEAASLSQTGDLIGTWHYMSPEQAAASTARPDARTDVFSLGVVLHELLTGQRPFTGEDRQELVHAILHRPPPPFPESLGLSRNVETITRKALEKEPRHRYATAKAFADDLRRLTNGKPIRARRPGPLRKADDFRRRHRAATAAVLALLIGVPLAIFVGWKLTDKAPRVTVVTDPPGAEVVAMRMDPEADSLGTPQRLGASPRSRVRLKRGPGYYRILATLDTLGVAEATRFLPERTTADIHLRVLPTSDVTRSMVHVSMEDSALVARVRAAFPDRPPPASFWIDRTEVSNADFRRFLEESGSDYWPPLWPEPASWDASWDPLPVAGIPFEQAQAYAEWNGKRLPTRAEWELAARSPDAWLYPWGAGPHLESEEVRKYANVFGDDPRVWSGPDKFPSLRTVYAAAVLPVATMPPGFRDSSWVGLYHVLGNVAEWTESVPVQESPEYQLRIIKGDHWARDIREHYSLSSHMTGSAKEGVLLGCGFRCAKSDFSGADAERAASPRLRRR